jgi:LysR family hydrogen peroxide-inducible transcriptional activator
MTRPNVTLRQLTYLRALRETGSVSAAARQMHVSQSTLSAGLKELECAVGAALIDRSRREAALTPAGEEAAARAGVVLDHVQALQAAALGAGAPMSGPLRLGVIPTLAPFVLPRLLTRLAEAYPDLQPRVREAPSGDLVHGVEQGELDCALLALPYPTGDLASAHVGRDPFFVLLPADDPLAKRAHLTEADLQDRALLVLGEEHCLREHTLAACSRPIGSKGADFSATSLYTLTALVSAGHGVTLVPGLAVARGLVQGPDLATVAFTGTEAHRDLAVIWRPASPRAGDARELARTAAAVVNEVLGSTAGSPECEPRDAAA